MLMLYLRDGDHYLRWYTAGTTVGLELNEVLV